MYNLDVEEMEGRWVAHVADLPGCFSSAETRPAAMSGAPAAIRAYFQWLKTHGEEVTEPAVETEAREIIRAWNSTPDYEVNAFFAADRRPLTEAEIGRALRLLEWTRADLLSAVEGLSAEDLQREVEREWSIARILRHTGGAEWWYLDRLDSAFPQQEVPEDPFQRLDRVRSHLLRILPSLAGDERVTVANHELWSPRKMLRRALWHERDHTDHIWQFRARIGRV